jgi:hypothetical protein
MTIMLKASLLATSTGALQDGFLTIPSSDSFYPQHRNEAPALAEPYEDGSTNISEHQLRAPLLDRGYGISPNSRPRTPRTGSVGRPNAAQHDAQPRLLGDSIRNENLTPMDVIPFASRATMAVRRFGCIGGGLSAHG